jgi:hypothetical protein
MSILEYLIPFNCLRTPLYSLISWLFIKKKKKWMDVRGVSVSQIQHLRTGLEKLVNLFLKKERVGQTNLGVTGICYRFAVIRSFQMRLTDALRLVKLFQFAHR